MEKTLLQQFISMAILSIDDKGIYPHHVMILDRDDKTIVISMPMDPSDLYLGVTKMMHQHGAKEAVIGLDRINMPDQGIDMKYHSVYTISHFSNGEWKIGAMPYASKDDVGEIQWDNVWWNLSVGKELKSHGFINPEPTDDVGGHAYKEKIMITSYRKTEMGTMYEGIINSEKLSEKVQSFLKERSLNINDRKAIISHIKDMGHKFEIFPEDFGFWTAKAGKGVFPARSSKTKVYLEAVESIIEN